MIFKNPLQCPAALEERESLTSNDSTAASLAAGFLVGLNLETSTPDTYRPPPTPLPYDILLGPVLTDSKSGRKTVSSNSFGALLTCEDLEESDCKAQANSELSPQKKDELSKSSEIMTEDEEVCPICLEGANAYASKILELCFFKFIVERIRTYRRLSLILTAENNNIIINLYS